MKRMIPMLLLLAILLAVANGASPVYASSYAQDSSIASAEYEYAITPESANWDTYSVVEKVVMLQIPDSKLTAMSNDELVAALASYPYLVDIYLYGDCVQDGVEVVRTYCSALNELLIRDPELNSVRNYLSAATKYNATTNATQLRGDDDFATTALGDIYLSVSGLLETCSSTAARTIDNAYTPNGTAVTLTARPELHTIIQHRTWDLEEIESVYHAELVEPGSCLYNCHYFAWHLNGDVDSDIHRWMNNPSAYMTDGSYNTTFTGNMNVPHVATNIRNGDIIFYGTIANINPSHSAICVETSITGNAIAYIHLLSKWGNRGVFMHDMSSVPYGYDTSTISAWRLA